MSSPNLITGSAENASQFAQLYAQCFEDAWDCESFATFFASPGIAGWLASTGHEPESFVLLRVAADECEILTLGTIASARRRGLAQFLLAHGAREAFARGARSMFLEVAETNAAARALYTALGFAPVGRRPAYYRGPHGKAVDALAWRAALPLGDRA